MPEISVVVPTFSSEHFIKSCLDSIFAQDYNNFEVIVVDNGSRDNMVSIVKDKFPQVILIENKENLGACKARNQAIEFAKGNWLLTLDCDVVLENNFLAEIAKAIKNLPSDIGMIQPKILKSDRKTIYSCGIYLSKLRRFYDVGKGSPDKGRFDKAGDIFGACSASALYRKQMFEELKDENGYFDERLFFLVEDVDLAWRAQKKGWNAIYYPEAVCYHSGNSSSTDRPRRQYLCWRNRKLMLKKYRINRFKLAIISLFYDYPHLIFLFLTNSYVRNEIKQV